MSEWTVERLARAIHVDHGLLLITGSWLDDEGEWHRWTDEYCLIGDRRIAENLMLNDEKVPA